MRNIIIKASAAGATPPKRVNNLQEDFKLGLYASISAGGVATFSAEYTPCNPEDEYPTDFATDAIWYKVEGLNGVSDKAVSNLFYPVCCVRLNVENYTSGEVELIITQSL